MSEGELEQALSVIWGIDRWDGELVARAVRSGALTQSRLFPEALAKLFEGTHPQGLRLVMHGQGNASTVSERAQLYDRLMSVGAFIETALSSGETWENALIDAADQFNISEATAARDLRLFRLSKE